MLLSAGIAYPLAQILISFRGMFAKILGEQMLLWLFLGYERPSICVMVFWYQPDVLWRNFDTDNLSYSYQKPSRKGQGILTYMVG